MLLLFWDGASPIAEPEVVYPTPTTQQTAVAVSNRAARVAVSTSNRASRVAKK
jgi:hypothetical protein